MADAEFTRSARRPAPVVEDPLIQWATGLTTVNRQIYAGWMVEAGKQDDLDGAMQSAGFSKVTIKHGSGSVVTHWAIETANMFILADGIQTAAELKRSAERYGVAYGWRTTDTGRQQSVLKARVMLRELLAVGYTDPLTLTVKSTVTGDVLTALLAQYEVLDAVDAFRALDGKPALNPPLYACHLPIGPGAEVARGSGSNTKEITPPVASIPRPITKEYIRAAWCKRDWVAVIEPLIDPTVAWSVAESQRITSGAQGEAQPPQSDEWRAIEDASDDRRRSMNESLL